MVIPLYADPAGGLHLVRPPCEIERVVARVHVPDGSEVAAIRVVGYHLFVPVDQWSRHAWTAEEVLRDARAGRRGFRVVT